MQYILLPLALDQKSWEQKLKEKKERVERKKRKLKEKKERSELSLMSIHGYSLITATVFGLQLKLMVI